MSIYTEDYAYTNRLYVCPLVPNATQGQGNPGGTISIMTGWGER